MTFTDRDGGYELGGWLDREAAEIVRSALSPLAAPRPTTDTEVDLRDAAQRDADALVELARRASDTGDLPTEGGERPQSVVTVTMAVLQGRIGAASLGLGGPINAEVARRIAYDSRVIPGRRYPAIPSTTVARRATTPQSPSRSHATSPESGNNAFYSRLGSGAQRRDVVPGATGRAE
ncbi:MAG: DUF222 domain-containing protein [Pseudonocardiaceae bacterium]